MFKNYVYLPYEYMLARRAPHTQHMFLAANRTNSVHRKQPHLKQMINTNLCCTLYTRTCTIKYILHLVCIIIFDDDIKK